VWSGCAVLVNYRSVVVVVKIVKLAFSQTCNGLETLTTLGLFWYGAVLTSIAY